MTYGVARDPLIPGEVEEVEVEVEEVRDGDGLFYLFVCFLSFSDN